MQDKQHAQLGEYLKNQLAVDASDVEQFEELLVRDTSYLLTCCVILQHIGTHYVTLTAMVGQSDEGSLCDAFGVTTFDGPLANYVIDHIEEGMFGPELAKIFADNPRWVDLAQIEHDLECDGLREYTLPDGSLMVCMSN